MTYLVAKKWNKFSRKLNFVGCPLVIHINCEIWSESQPVGLTVDLIYYYETLYTVNLVFCILSSHFAKCLKLLDNINNYVL